MEIVTTVTSLLHLLLTSIDVNALIEQPSWLTGLFDGLPILVQGKGGKCDPCPGSEFTAIAAAYANIGYMTQSDLLYFITETKFGLWGPLLYIAAAVGALVSVAIGQPPRTYMWFMLGPAVYSFLISTTQEVKGVDWTVAGVQQGMREVWRDAEPGANNTQLVAGRKKITFNKVDGPSGTYPVATAFLYLDELFSTTTNLIVGWSGLYFSDGTGAANTNLAARKGQAEGPWYILSNSKWGMVENMVSATARNPNVRDALVTFLTNECGDAFKRGIADGRFIAAATSRGAVLPGSVFKTQGGDTGDFTGKGNAPQVDYQYATAAMHISSIPTPKGLANLFNDFQGNGSFGKFSPMFDGKQASSLLKRGRDSSIVCAEYLFTIIQALRWESGHAYHQILRSSPRGLDTNELLRNLFYGWDVRKQADVPYASDEEMVAFAKMLIFVHMVRNELLFAPQITKTDARYAPADQSRSFSEAYVRTSGSKSKFSELYQWAVLMPHLQGVLLYIIIIGYPFACMLMVLPGYWKAFFTWVSFFAWLKLWDVGFAIVQVLERSVWGMIGNRSSMARLANMMIQTATSAGSIGVSCPDGSVGPPPQDGDDGALSKSNLSLLCAIPNVCSVNGLETDCPAGGAGGNQTKAKAWELFDRALLMGAGVDLDLSNGYYIYIMSALYFAVPAVTGQLVLGAKSGVANMVSGAIGGVTAEAGKAAATGYQHAAVNAAQTNQASVGQAAYAKAMRAKSNGDTSLAGQILEAGNDGMKAGIASSIRDGQQKYVAGKASALDQFAGHRRQAAGLVGAMYGAAESPFKAGGNVWKAATSPTKSGTGGTAADVTTAAADGVNNLGKQGVGLANAASQFAHDSRARRAGYAAQSGALDAHWDMAVQGARRDGAQATAGRLSKVADFDAATAAWEAKNAFASHASSAAGIAGMNAGNLSPGHKPQDMEGMAFRGQFGAQEQALAQFPLSFASNARSIYGAKRQQWGGSAIQSDYTIGSTQGWNISNLAGDTAGYTAGQGWGAIQSALIPGRGIENGVKAASEAKAGFLDAPNE